MTISDNMSDIKNPKNPFEYICESCDFKCCNKKDYGRHLLTAKHKMMTNSDIKPQKTPKNPTAYMCICGKSYKYRQGLSLHKKKCSHENVENTYLPISKPEPVNKVIYKNISEETVIKGFQEMMQTQMAAQMESHAAQAAAAAEQTRLLVEAITLNGPQCITNNNTTNNNQFNLNVFLNEDCKDAYTLKEVMDSIECTVTDLDRMDHDGYVATITRKILESIQDMDITERPIHCTDARRNTVCVKNETGWEKNEKAMKLLANSVLLIGRKLGRMVDDWRLVYPDHFRGTVTRREQYHRLIADIMKVNDLDVEARIASKICKSIVLDRKAVMER